MINNKFLSQRDLSARAYNCLNKSQIRQELKHLGNHSFMKICQNYTICLFINISILDLKLLAKQCNQWIIIKI